MVFQYQLQKNPVKITKPCISTASGARYPHCGQVIQELTLNPKHPREGAGLQSCPNMLPPLGMEAEQNSEVSKGSSVVSYLNHLLRDLCAAFLF